MIEDFDSHKEMIKYFKKTIQSPTIFTQIKLFTQLSDDLQDELIAYHKNETVVEEPKPVSTGLSFGPR